MYARLRTGCHLFFSQQKQRCFEYFLLHKRAAAAGRNRDRGPRTGNLNRRGPLAGRATAGPAATAGRLASRSPARQLATSGLGAGGAARARHGANGPLPLANRSSHESSLSKPSTVTVLRLLFSIRFIVFNIYTHYFPIISLSFQLFFCCFWTQLIWIVGSGTVRKSSFRDQHLDVALQKNISTRDHSSRLCRIAQEATCRQQDTCSSHPWWPSSTGVRHK